MFTVPFKKKMKHHLCKLAVYFPFLMIVIITGEYMSHFRLQLEHMLHNESNILWQIWM